MKALHWKGSPIELAWRTYQPTQLEFGVDLQTVNVCLASKVDMLVDLRFFSQQFSVKMLRFQRMDTYPTQLNVTTVIRLVQ